MCKNDVMGKQKFTAALCAMGLLVAAFSSPSAKAQQPPNQGCVAVSQQEYDSAKRQKLLRTRFSAYIRTGRIGRRFYWYCRG
jgi:hypothetical protein